MKLKRPLTSVDIQLIIVGTLAAVALLPYFFRVGTARWMETRRLQTASTYVFPSQELAELDRLLQVRFAERPTNDFGMGRIGVRHEIFKALNNEEKHAIEALRKQKQDVVFYVAGRNYLKKWPTAGAYDALLQGPVFMTQKLPLKVKAPQTFNTYSWGGKSLNQPQFQTEKRPVDLPTEVQLNNSLGLMLISASSSDHTATPDGKTYRAGDWQVAAVPVRATDQFCIDCHFRFSRRDEPRLGDPLGIALYAFRSTAEHPTKTKSVSLPPMRPSR